MIRDWLRGLFECEKTVYRECRRCGTTIAKGAEPDACPQCGHTEVAVYEFP